MTALRQLITPADSATWAGRILGLLIVAFFAWLAWQALPLLIGDLLALAESLSW